MSLTIEKISSFMQHDNPSAPRGAAPATAHHWPLGDFHVSKRVLLVIAMAAVVGVFGVLAAWILTKLIALATNAAYFQTYSTVSSTIRDTPLGWGRLFIPAAGGVLIGLMARYGSEKIRGHGIPEAIEAILIGGSRMQPKVALLKPLSSAISIGSGGPFGAEGPIIMTGGALGSLFAQLVHLTPSERKALLVAGAAAGMTGIFGTPLAAILLAVELLLFEWRPRSFLPVAMAVIVAATLRTQFLPSGPLFPMSAEFATEWRNVLSWFGIGILTGIGSAVLTALVYGTEDLFAKLPIHWMWWPAIGGLVVGVGGLIEPAALGVGYDNIQSMLHGELGLHALLMLLVVKALIWAIALGSGTSGGVLAPLLIIGGALGGMIGALFDPTHAMQFALLSMAAMMGGTMRSPLTATLFALELTGDMHALLPLVAACAASHLVTVLILKRSILTERIARRGHHILREYSVDPFETTRVREVMVSKVDTLPTSMSIETTVRFFTADEQRHKSYPVVDERGKLCGMVSRGDILRWERAEEVAPTLGEAVSLDGLVVGRPDEVVARIADRMAQADVGRVPVVDAGHHLVGLMARKDLLHARARLIPHDHERSAPLLPRYLGGKS
jgi:H+/Cl- antiporter ClcA